MMDRTFVTADQHFDHKNIIRHCKRPFKDVAEMDNVLVDAWNDKVSPNDVVYHLGDFTLQGWRKAYNYFARLNGRIKVLQNVSHHDKKWLGYLDGVDPNECIDKMWPRSAGIRKIELLEPLVTIEVAKQVIVLCHFPMASWDRKHRGAWHLYAHSHGAFEDVGLMMDVGVDAVRKKYSLPAYAPVPLSQVASIMQRRIEKSGSWDRLTY